MPDTRLGSIEFINSLPVDLGLLSGAVSFDGTITQGAPKALNCLMQDGGLDISPVSAFFFAKYSELFYVLPDLSISSLNGVESVLLISRKNISELAGEPIAVTEKGQTTPVLLEIICRLKYGFKPVFVQNRGDNSAIPANAAALLVIGDEALLAKERLAGNGLCITDLAKEWTDWTGFPIVFALWAVRRDFFAKAAESAHKTHQAILKSKAWGLKNQDRLMLEAKRRVALPEPVIRAYFSLLTHELNEKLLRGMNLYFKYAAECGLLNRQPEIEMMPALSVAQKN